MIFTSIQFIFFLTIVLIAYWTLPKKIQWCILLFASILFYFSIGRKRIIFIITSAISTWIIANLIYKVNTKEKEYLSANKAVLSREERTLVKKAYKNKRFILLLAFLAYNLGGLFIFKFYNFAAELSSKLPHLNLIMPLGISFYTLQISGYVIDIYNKKTVPEKSVFKTMLFAMYFPRIIQGPISRFDQISNQLFKEKTFDYDMFALGCLRMIWGYFKKLVIADRFSPVVTTLFSNYTEYAGFEIILAAFLYTIQLYADFSGGIDIALGASELFGIKLPENFNRPFFSKTISEFWRRWHMTLGAFLRDYIFYPVTLSKPLSKLSRFFSKNNMKWAAKWVPAYISLFILWFCSGIWHGEGLQFIMYGLYHGTIIMIGLTIEPIVINAAEKYKINRNSNTYKLFQVARTFLLVTIGEIIFRSRSVSQAMFMIKAMFSKWNPWVLFDGFILTLGIDARDLIVGMIAIVILLVASLLNRKISVREWIYNQELPIRWGICLAAIMCIILFGAYGPDYDPTPFIYFQF